MSTTIAVGVDGSEPSLIALRWAVDAAAIREAQVIAVVAARAALDRSRQSVKAVERRRRRISDHVAEVQQAIERVAGDVQVRMEVLEGSATGVLIDISGRVDLLVVGGHGYNGWRDALTPSVSGRLAVHTQAALCVTRTVPEPPRRRIVVGHDGNGSMAAVRFAVTEAALRGASVRLVTTWHYPRDTTATSPDTAGLLEEGAAAAQREILHDVRQTHPDVPIDADVHLGEPVEVLAELAESADMVVVGSHRRRGFLHRGPAALVVGSVAIGLLRRLTLPVVIVPRGRAA